MVNELVFSNTIKFNGTPISEEIIGECFDFAYNMAKGFHREYRSGGNEVRRPNQIFANAFQGKLAECVLYNELIAKGYCLEKPDFKVYERGIWDSEDLEVNGKYISIKSTSFKGQYLLLETKDHDKNGTYSPNNKAYDYTVLIRIEPDIKKELQINKILYNPELSLKNDLKSIKTNAQWKFDIAGYITNSDLKDIIAKDQYIYQGGTINKYTIMDAENYYIESGNMKRIESLYTELRN